MPSLQTHSTYDQAYSCSSIQSFADITSPLFVYKALKNNTDKVRYKLGGGNYPNPTDDIEGAILIEYMQGMRRVNIKSHHYFRTGAGENW